MAKKGSDYIDKEFSFQLEKISELMMADVQSFMQKTVFELYRRITVKSPVNTGRFKGNWNVSFGKRLS